MMETTDFIDSTVAIPKLKARMRPVFFKSERLDAFTNAPVKIKRYALTALLDLADDQCRWPIEKLFCGQLQLPECPYCGPHELQAHDRTRTDQLVPKWK